MFINVAQFKSVFAALWHNNGKYTVYVYNGANVQVAVKEFDTKRAAVAWREINGAAYGKADKKN